ncbi:MAG: TetR/AcrR family transcriptional regulator [Eubacteriaceae bacterium]
MANLSTKELILQVSKELFYNQGYIKTTIRQIRIGASNQNIHYYYKNKKDLAAAIYEGYLMHIRSEILNYNIPELTDNFLLYFVMHIKVYKHILKDPHNRKYYIESMKDSQLEYIKIIFDKEFDQVTDIAKKNYEKVLTIDTMKYYAMVVLSCQEAVFTNYFEGNLNFSLDEIIKMILELVPQLFGVSEEITKEYYEKAQNITSVIDLSHIKLLI